jgi:MFS family permease
MTPAVPARTWIAIVGATLGAFMAILNIQIVNASLADIQGAIGAGTDDGAWISTAYLTAEIIAIPLTGWLASVFSMRRYLIANAALFLLFSVACAFARNLEQMIVLRALQGFCGGVLIPMAFILIVTLLPPARQAGFGLFAASNFMNVAISADVAGEQLLLPNVVRAVGQALVLTPLTTLAVAGIEAEDNGSASALLNVLRNLGGAIGIALLQTFLVRREHFHTSALSQSVSLFNENTRNLIDQFERYFMNHGVVDPATAWHKAVVAIAGRVHQQAYILAFGDVFLLLGVVLVVAILAALLLKKPVPSAR